MRTIKIVKTVVWIIALLVLFYFCLGASTTLQFFSISIFIFTLGMILDVKKSFLAKVLKWLIYSLYFLYSLWNLGIFVYLQDFDVKNLNQFIFGFVAPLCLVVFIKIISNYKVRGYKIFNYHFLFILYIIVALVWHEFYPEEVNLIFLFAFWIISYIIIVIYYYQVHKNLTKNKG